MNLIVDQGNTNAKLAVCDGNEIVHSVLCQTLALTDLKQIFGNYDIKASIVSTVVDMDTDLLNYINKKSERFVFLDENTPLPIENLYKSPKTLGRDRIAACVGANGLKPNSNLLVIDIGTAMTFDVVNSQNQYVGGNISLGIEMRLKALHYFTGKLPLVERKESFSLIGRDTEDAILAGVLNGMVGEIDSYIREIMLIYPNLTVFLTGGGAFYFERLLKNVIFANCNLITIGLNRILNS